MYLHVNCSCKLNNYYFKYVIRSGDIVFTIFLWLFAKCSKNNTWTVQCQCTHRHFLAKRKFFDLNDSFWYLNGMQFKSIIRLLSDFGKNNNVGEIVSKSEPFSCIIYNSLHPLDKYINISTKFIITHTYAHYVCNV